MRDKQVKAKFLAEVHQKRKNMREMKDSRVFAFACGLLCTTRDTSMYVLYGKERNSLGCTNKKAFTMAKRGGLI
jgi:hypothetical protein